MDFRIVVKDINKLGTIDVTAIYTRLSWSDSGSDSSIQKELARRYLTPATGPHPEMAIALVWCDDVLVGWVGTRLWPERFKGEKVMAQTVECFVDPEYRHRGFAQLGLQALISAGLIDKTQPVSVYAKSAIELARKGGCKIVLLCNV